MLQNRFALPLYAQSMRLLDVDVRAAKHYIALYVLCLCKQCNTLQTFATFAVSKVGYWLPTNMASPDPKPARCQYNCVCLKYGSGQPHMIPSENWTLPGVTWDDQI